MTLGEGRLRGWGGHAATALLLALSLCFASSCAPPALTTQAVTAQEPAAGAAPSPPKAVERYLPVMPDLPKVRN